MNIILLQVFGKLSTDSGITRRKQASGEQTGSIPSSPVKKQKQQTPIARKDSQIKKLTNCNIELNPKYISTACRWFDHVLALKSNLGSSVTKFELELESAATAGQVIVISYQNILFLSHDLNHIRPQSSYLCC